MIDPVGFASAITNAKSGDTLALAPGNYGDRIISKKAGLTIIAPEGAATFNTLQINGCNGVRASGLTVAMAFKDGVTHADSHVVGVNASTDVELSKCRLNGCIALTGVPQAATSLDGTKNVIGLASGFPIWTYNANGVRLTHCDISTGWRNTQFLSSKNITVEDCDLHDARASHIAGSVSEGLIVRRNHIWRSKPWGYGGSYDHGDAMTNWTWASMGHNTRNVTFEDNLFEALDGQDIIGLYMMAHDGTYNWGYENLNLLRNVIISSASQPAFYIERGISGLVQDNIVLMNPAHPVRNPWVKLSGPNGMTITGNRFPSISWTTAPSGWLTKVKAANTIGATKPGEADAAVKAWLAKFRAP